MAICKDMEHEELLLDLWPHPEDRYNTRDRLERLKEQKSRTCTCGSGK